MVISELYDLLDQYENAKECYEYLRDNKPIQYVPIRGLISEFPAFIENDAYTHYEHNLKAAKEWMLYCGNYSTTQTSMLCKNCMEVGCEC